MLPIYLASQSQEKFFLYFESEQHQPFYLKMGDKVYSSETSGYFLLPSLSEGKYQFIVGFSGEQKRENRFEVAIEGKDNGYMIQEKSGLLYLKEMHSDNKIKPVDDPGMAGVTYEIRTDAFSILLSKASNDPSLVRVPVFPVKDVAKETPAAKLSETETIKDAVVDTDATEVVVKSDVPPVVEAVLVDSVKIPQSGTNIEEEVAAVSDSVIADPIFDTIEVISAIPEVIPDTLPASVSGVLRYSESSTAEGFLLSFIDLASNDTIRLVIPNPRFKLVEDIPVKEEENLFLDIERKDLVKDSLPSVEANTKTDQPQIIVSNEKTPGNEEIKPGNNCRKIAGEKDFFKLRKNMAAHSSDEAMVDEARKAFRSRCYTTEQVKHLSGLFLTSAGKYLFFDAAYFHVSDREAFPQLKAEISDDYYLRRFHTLIGER